MDAHFWRQKWERNEIGFHEGEANRLLVRHFNALSLSERNRVFIPLCGKTLDIAWLLSRGYRVVGAELIETAIVQLFAELGLDPEISELGQARRYSAKDIDVFVGDIFGLSSEILGPVDAIYDRAALVALPEEIRRRYTGHLVELSEGAPQLLITFEYDQRAIDGPPFSVDNEEVMQHYRGRYELTLVESLPIPGGLKGKCAATENVWLLGK